MLKYSLLSLLNIMKLRQIIPLLFIIIPIIEIILFIEIGSILGSFNTILMIFLSAFLGIYLIKHGSISYMHEIQSKIMQGIRPDADILSGILIFLSGILLVLPGFFTDVFGLILILKPIQSIIASRYAKNTLRPKATKKKSKIIDVDYKEEE